MTTIDKLDIGIYIQYAKRTQMIEQINKQYRFDEASSIPPQTSIVDLYPKLSEMDLLLGVARTYAPWALFLPPKLSKRSRRGPFTFSRVIPSLGSDEDQEEREELLERQPCLGEDEKAEKQALGRCFKQINQLNEWLGHIVGNVGRFLQG